MRNARVLFTCWFMIVPGMALAVSKPPELTPVISANQPVGQASLNKMLMHIYDAQFWSDSGDWKKAPYAITIIYDMDFTRDELADRTYGELRHVSSLPPDTLKLYAEKLRGIYPAVVAGDRLTALQKNRQITAFYYNGKPIGEIHDADFGPAFFAIWLSLQSSELDMRKQLLATETVSEGI